MNSKEYKDIVLIQCSARKNGDTAIVCNWLENNFSLSVIHLCEYNIHPFDYDNKYEDDDFLSLVSSLAHQSKTIFFVTPVYWYTMSGRMKIFLDRITDLMKWHKDTGRLFRGKNIGLISVSNDSALNDCFDTPVHLSAGYLGMSYLGHLHSWVIDGTLTDGVKESLSAYFTKSIKNLS